MGDAEHLRRRAFLYITKQGGLLVLRHVDFPDLGLQIPGGTIEPGEEPIVAAAREAREETGLDRLGGPVLLGHTTVPSERADERFLDAWFFHIEAAGPVPNTWHHLERFASGAAGDVRFALSWITVSEAAAELGDNDRLMLDALG